MKTTNWFKTSLTAAALVALTAPQLAHASPENASDITKVNVQVNDLNLANADGVEVLYQRLSYAARMVCGSNNDLKSAGSLKQLRMNKECFESTLAAALADVNFTQLAQASGFSNRSQS